MPQNTLGKEEKLKSRKKIDALFSAGKSIYKHPFKLVYLIDSVESEYSTKFAVTVPKKNFKRAVDRNLIKRRIREAYRTQNTQLKNYCSTKKLVASFMVIYLETSILDSKQITIQIKELLDAFIKKI